MNKQELIKEFEEIGIHGLNMFGTVVKGIPTETAIDLIKQLDEPRKVKVKKFVADWIEHCRGLGYSLYQAMELVHENAEIKKWFIFVDNQDLFARAWLDGYEIEEEKRYMVRVRGICGNHEFLNCEKHSKKWLFSDRKENTLYDTKFTRKELEEADFGWVFDCPGIEIEEVE